MMNRKILFTAILMAAVVSISGCRDSKESGTAEQRTFAEKTKDRTEHLSQNETDTEKSTDEVLIKETAKSAGEAEGSGEEKTGTEGNRVQKMKFPG